VSRTVRPTLHGRADEAVVVRTPGESRRGPHIGVTPGTGGQLVGTPPLAVGALGDTTAYPGLLLGGDGTHVRPPGVAVQQFDARLVDRESGGFADDLALAGLGVEAPDTDRVGKAVEVGARDVGLGREDDFVEQRQRDVGPELVAQVSRTLQVGFVLDGDQRVDPVGVASDLPDCGVAVLALALEVPDLDGAVGDRAGALGVTVEGVGRPDRAPGTDVALDRQRRDGLGRDRPTGVELRTRFDGDDVDDPAAVDGAAELAGVEAVGPLAFQAGTQREFERELHTEPVRAGRVKIRRPNDPNHRQIFARRHHSISKTPEDTMDSNTPVTGQDSGRGQSGMIGFVIVVGMVIAGAVVVVFAGSTALTDLQQERTDAQAEIVMEEVDSQLTTITSSDQSATGYFSLGDLDRQESRVVREGHLNVTVNRRTSCRANVPLSSIRYESDDDETVAYQAGGVFVANDNGSAVQTPPNLQFRNGSLDVTVTNVTGTVSNTRTGAFYNATSSTNQSAFLSRKVISGECVRPNNVTVHVRSDFYRAWGNYLRDELNASADGVTVRIHDSNRTAYAYISQSRLPRRVDDNRNNVVNLSTSPVADYMEDVDTSGNSITINKTGSNEYAVYVQPMSERRVDIGEIRRIENAQNVTGPPIDVVFVMDESGSMSWDANPEKSGCSQGESHSYCTSKREAAITAAQNFVGQLNSSKDRVALVGFHEEWNSKARYFRTNGQYLTDDFDEFNDTLTDIDASGGTNMWAALRDGNKVQGLVSDQTRERVVILLSDGENDDETVEIGDTYYDEVGATRFYAREADEMDVTIHTIGFGDESYLNEPLLKDVNGTTGGQYYFADNASELGDAFVDIATRVASTKQIARTPTSTNLTSESGAVFSPQIAGDIDGIASSTVGGNRFLNINDPTAPTHFSHAFPLSDEEAVTFNASIYECADGNGDGSEDWRGTGITRTHNGSSYQVVRCTTMTTVDRTLDEDDVDIYTDGDSITSLVTGDEPGWWQDSINDTIDSRRNVDRVTDGSDIYLEMKSNQAMVVLDYPDGASSTNRLVLLYQIGRAESDVRGEGVINIRVRNVEVDS